MLVVRLPWPDTRLSPNRKNGRAWQSTARLKTEQREAAYLCTEAALNTAGKQDFSHHIPLSLLFMAPDKRHRDLDNLLACSKALIDGMAQSLGVDDSRFKPITIDVIHVDKEACVVAGVGVEMISGVQV